MDFFFLFILNAFVSLFAGGYSIDGCKMYKTLLVLCFLNYFFMLILWSQNLYINTCRGMSIDILQLPFLIKKIVVQHHRHKIYTTTRSRFSFHSIHLFALAFGSINMFRSVTLWNYLKNSLALVWRDRRFFFSHVSPHVFRRWGDESQNKIIIFSQYSYTSR